jgi:hypothetical protein
MKAKPGLAKERVWARAKTLMFVLAGLLPAVGLMLVIWRFNTSYLVLVDMSGMLMGLLFAWGLYVLFMLVAHVGLWRRDLF